MTGFECEKCHLIFKYKHLLEKHREKLPDCLTKKRGLFFTCDFCNRCFVRKTSVDKHLPKCLLKPSKVTDGEYVHVDDLFDFSTDGIEDIHPMDLNLIFSNELGILEGIIIVVNFNPSKPTHHNIYYSNSESKYGEYYEHNNWKICRINTIIDRLIDAKIIDLKIISESIYINNNSKSKINKIIRNIDKNKYRENIAISIKKLLFDNSHIVMKTRKITSRQITDANYYLEQIKT